MTSQTQEHGLLNLSCVVFQYSRKNPIYLKNNNTGVEQSVPLYVRRQVFNEIISFTEELEPVILQDYFFLAFFRICHVNLFFEVFIICVDTSMVPLVSIRFITTLGLDLQHLACTQTSRSIRRKSTPNFGSKPLNKQSYLIRKPLRFDTQWEFAPTLVILYF